MTHSMQAVRRATIEGLDTAVHQNKALSKAGLLERLFTLAFRGLVYPQIWEDPVVDMAALAIKPDDHVVAIASGSCNVLSYLAADPAKISAVDLNGAHIALGRLKLCALRYLPTIRRFLRFSPSRGQASNFDVYTRDLLPRLDPETAAYWNARRPFLKRRIHAFSRNFYHYGLLGKFIGFGHLIGRFAGCRPEALLAARSLEEQRSIFETTIAPVFQSRLAQWLSRQPAALFGLGIPPSQYKKLSADLPGGIVAVLHHRLERLACGFDIHENYFAWQAFGRRYPLDNQAALPPYLQERSFATIRERTERVTLRQNSMTDFLRAQPATSVDCVVLLDAQDWMDDGDLTALWTEITRTARPGARVIFRTAADERLLPGRIPAGLLGAWTYDEAECRALGARDRSSIYGGFHLYRLADKIRRMSAAAGPLMDRIYTSQRHIYDATRKFYLLGRDGLISDLKPSPGALVLEVGCGTARNLISVALRYPDVICFGLDVSQAMLETARRSVARAGLSSRIHLAEADATSFDPQALFGVPQFDRVLISYALSMIPPWEDVLRHASTVVAPGGALHIVDFGDQARLPKIFKTLLDLWLSKFHVTPRLTLPQEVERLAREQGLKASTRAQFRGYAFRAELVRT